MSAKIRKSQTAINLGTSAQIYNLTLSLPSFYQKGAIFNQFLGCHDAKWALVFAEKLIFYQIGRFPKIRYKNVEYFNLVHAHKPKFGLLDLS